MMRLALSKHYTMPVAAVAAFADTIPVFLVGSVPVSAEALCI